VPFNDDDFKKALANEIVCHADYYTPPLLTYGFALSSMLLSVI
jgi:hypothetical protein